MDMTTNYVSSSQATIDHQKLYNAAQSGIEWGKAWLVAEAREEDSGDLYSFWTYDADDFPIPKGPVKVDDPTDIKSKLQVHAESLDVPELEEHVSVVILTCNYESDGSSPHNTNKLYLPPPVIKEPAIELGSGGSGTIPAGFSRIYDPNRQFATAGEIMLQAYVIRSQAVGNNDISKTLESLVVIVQ